MQTTQATDKTFCLPMRLAFKPDNGGRRDVVAGTPGSHGDAGWTVVEFPSIESAMRCMSEYPQARMPCWKRIESGEITS